jgi:hypothetical protein
MTHVFMSGLCAAADAPSELTPLSPVGWLVMIVSIGAVLALTGFCVYRVLRLPPVEEETLKGPLEIDTRDISDAD